MTAEQMFDNLLRDARKNVVGEVAVASLVAGLTMLGQLPDVKIQPEDNNQVFVITRGDVQIKLECNQDVPNGRVAVKHSIV